MRRSKRERLILRSPVLSRIAIFPIKALDPLEVTGAAVTPGGSLAWDRRFAIVDRSGNYVNGKRNHRVHLLRAQYDLERSTVRFGHEGGVQGVEFRLEAGEPALEHWLSDYFGEPVTFEENADAGFPDDTNASGPTVVSDASLKEVASWFPGLGDEGLRRRFRVNLVVEGVPAFWEDLLLPDCGESRFRVGAVELEGVNACARCVVPTRDPETAGAIPGFQRIFMERRAATLPAGVRSDRFDHFYRFTLNTVIAPGQAGKTLRVGDVVVHGAAAG